MTVIPLSSPWLHVRPTHGEGVVWDARRGVLLFVDVPAGRIWEYDEGSARLSSFDVSGSVGAVHPVADGESLIIADSDGIARCSHGRLVERLANHLASRPDVRMNDANVDPAGRYFAGTMALDARAGAGELFRLDIDGTVTTVVDGATVSNGIDWSPDGTLCYWVDSPLRRVDVFDYEVANGTLSNRRPFVDTKDVPGVPDGLTVDGDGGVWVAFFGGARVCRFAPDATLDLTIGLPVDLVTSCCFGGASLEDIFISTSTEDMSAEDVARQPAAGGIFRTSPGYRGKPGTPFG